MQNKNAVLAFVILSTVGLGACSKNNKHGLKAKAEIAKATGDQTKKGDVYAETQRSIDKDIAKVKELGVPMGAGILESITSKVLGAKVSGQNRSEAKRRLQNIIDKADIQIGLAKEMQDSADQKEQAERTKSNAATLLGSLQAQEDSEKADAEKDAQKTGKDQNKSASEEKNFLGF